MSILESLFAARVSTLRTRFKAYMDQHGGQSAGPSGSDGVVRIKDVIGGPRNVGVTPSYLSVVDPTNGVMYVGRPVKEFVGPSLEATIFRLLVGRPPSETELTTLQTELRELAQPDSTSIDEAILPFARENGVMSGFLAGLNWLDKPHDFQTRSAAATKEDGPWRVYLNESLRLIANLPVLAAKAYLGASSHRSTRLLNDSDALSMTDRFAAYLGCMGDERIGKVLAAHQVLHMMHETGNVSANASMVVGSALGTPASICRVVAEGLAAPLHGGAAEDVLRFQDKLREHDPEGTEDKTVAFLEALLKDPVGTGKIPGFGHAVLRAMDVRATVFYDLSKSLGLAHWRLERARLLAKVVPGVLQRLKPNVANPHPNVDQVSGSVLAAIGIEDPQFMVVLFAMSRACGMLLETLIHRALKLGIYRPDSFIFDLCSENP